LSVLVLEDRASDAELMVRELQRSGYDPTWRRVDTEREYREALDEPPDVILADYSLPQFDAGEALRLLQDRNLDVPFVVVTGILGEEAAVDCMKRGAADYVLKDRMARLGQAVQRALSEKALRDERQRTLEAL